MLSLVLLAACGKEGSPLPGDEAAGPTPSAPSAPPRTAQTTAEYGSLCEPGGIPFDGAPRYERKASPKEPSKLAVFEKYVDSDDPTYREVGNTGIGGWSSELPASIELVACVDLVRGKLRRTCRFEEGHTLDLYDMTHQLRVIEASTGKTVLETKLELQGIDECPSFAALGTGANYRGTRYGQSLLRALIPLQPEGATLPQVESYTSLKDTCAGVPFPQTPPYDPSRPGPRAVLTTYRLGPDAPYGFFSPEGVQSAGAAETDVSKYQLVVCATGTATKKRRECKFDEDHVLELHDGEVKVEVYETHTAKRVEEKTFAASGEAECPFVHEFEGERDVALGKLGPDFQRYLASLEGRTP